MARASATHDEDEDIEMDVSPKKKQTSSKKKAQEEESEEEDEPEDGSFSLSLVLSNLVYIHPRDNQADQILFPLRLPGEFTVEKILRAEHSKPGVKVSC